MTPPKTPQSQPKKPKKPPYKPNPETRNATARARWANRGPAERLEHFWRREIKPARPTPGSSNSNEPRKVALAASVPTWNDTDECFRTYMAAAVMSDLTGELYVVDHIVPLLNPLVCGLHGHSNLQVVHWAENRLKSNVYWPDMPDINWDTLDFLVQNAQYLPKSRRNSA